jgi:hypothetical protein
VERLVAARLLVRGKRHRIGEAAEATLEVAHEALLRQWGTLRRLLDRASSDLKAIQIVTRAASAWYANGRTDEWLDHKGDRLAHALRLGSEARYRARLDETAHEYLATCREVEDRTEKEREAQLEARERAQGRARWATYGLLFIAFIALAGAIIQTRETAKREAIVLTSAANEALREGQYYRAMRIALLGLPKRYSLPLLTPWSAELEAKLAGGHILSRNLIRQVDHGVVLNKPTFAPDGRRLLINSGVDVRLWDIASGKDVNVLRHELSVLESFFSPDGTHAVTNTGKSVQLWNLQQGSQIATFEHDGFFLSSPFSPDGRRIVTRLRDGTILLWDAVGGVKIRLLRIRMTAPL